MLRVVSYGTVALRYHRFASIHTYMNKATGLAVFLVPFCVMQPIAAELCTVVCVIAVLGSAEELLIHLCTSTYQDGVQTIFKVKR